MEGYEQSQKITMEGQSAGTARHRMKQIAVL